MEREPGASHRWSARNLGMEIDHESEGKAKKESAALIHHCLKKASFAQRTRIHRWKRLAHRLNCLVGLIVCLRSAEDEATLEVPESHCSF